MAASEKEGMSARRPGIFLDRDGTINVDSGYVRDPGALQLIPRAAAAVALLNSAGFPVVVVSNQSGVARGYFDEDSVRAVNTRLSELLAGGGAHIDHYYWCPHHPDGTVAAYRQACDCRKPGSALLLRAAEAHHIDLARSYMIGDKFSDVGAGKGVGAKTILVRSGEGERQLLRPAAEHPAPDYIAADLLAAVQWILQREQCG